MKNLVVGVAYLPVQAFGKQISAISIESWVDEMEINDGETNVNFYLHKFSIVQCMKKGL